MIKPVADMRGVKYFNVEEPYYQKNSGFLCERCGMSDRCSEYHQDVIECYGFLPIIKFAPPLGNMEGVFNTVRLGRAWPDRLKVGSRVMLQNAKTEEYIGEAEVLSVESDDLPKVCKKHYKSNHLMKNIKFKSARSGSEKMQAILRQCYGKLYYENASGASVIYMKLINGS